MQITDLDRTVLTVGPVANNPQAQQDAAAPGKTLPPETARPQTPAPVDPAAVKDAVLEVNRKLEMKQHAVRLIASDSQSGTIIEVIDKSTDTVIRQIPSEAVVRLSDWWSENGMLSSDSAPALAVDETA